MKGSFSLADTASKQTNCIAVHVFSVFAHADYEDVIRTKEHLALMTDVFGYILLWMHLKE